MTIRMRGNSNILRPLEIASSTEIKLAFWYELIGLIVLLTNRGTKQFSIVYKRKGTYTSPDGKSGANYLHYLTEPKAVPSHSI
ncbi:hypothetical protein D0C36_16065 [Mucilaginibacter conchicola]|uniref:Uncharacterized protein n=1 Tax=Mucilaginibacter conchicola TaxID=2303333 RepID=A0A372NUK1_9SPHI|nr:hypothetical protein D0C36_16065 [Mucilaginibacter conchicola]